MTLYLTHLTRFLQGARPTDVLVCISLLSLLAYQLRRLFRPKSTSLPGPPRQSLLFGVSQQLFRLDNQSILLEEWSKKYGPVLRLPVALGSSRVVLCDPKAATYFYSKETTGFVSIKQSKIFIERLFGKGLIWAEGESHRRQRKALTPAFSVQAIRALTTVFFDSAYKVKTAWDAALDAAPGGEATFDIQKWMNKVSLDTIGIAGFSHDFGTLDGHRSTVADVFDSFTNIQINRSSLATLSLFLISPVLPLLTKIPTSRMRTIGKLNIAMEKISDDLLARTRREKGVAVTGKGPKSVIETLILAEGAQSELTLSESEVLAQMKTLILAGYETTSISLTWCLINLALQPSTQDTLRAELSEFTTDPTFEQITNGLPFLDAVAKETFRLHPPVAETTRVAATDHVIPLGTPLTTPAGETLDRIHITAGTMVSVPIRLLNTSTTLWGADSRTFRPARWLEGIPDPAKEIHGFSHLFTFVDGPRACIGRQFAVTEFKVVLATLLRHYEFRLPNGKDTKFEKVVGILPRPRVEGEQGSCVPMLIKRVE